MTKPNKPINILLYEDNAEYAVSFKVAAAKERIIVSQVDNVEDLLEKYKSNPRKYQFIVLDAKAFRYEGQQAGTESEMYLIKIIQELDKLKYLDGIHIPYCINTGFADIKLRLSDAVQCSIFEKGDEHKLFEHIWAAYLNTSRAHLLLKHPEIFEFAEEHFEDAAYELLSQLFKNERYKSNDIADRISNLSSLRRTAEYLTDVIYKKHLAPNGVRKPRPSSRLREIVELLNKQQGMPPHVYNTLNAIRETANTYGSHNPVRDTIPKDYPSGEMIGGYASSLKDVFTWASGKTT